MVIKFNLKKLLISLAIPLLTGGVSALITGADMKMYGNINKPPLSPPMAVFPVVWTLLFILMGVSFYLVWNGNTYSRDNKIAYAAYFISLFLNFIWTPIFFVSKQYILAFAVLVLLLVTVIVTVIEYYKTNKCAAILQIPYIIWLVFAGYLNLGVYMLNK